MARLSKQPPLPVSKLPDADMQAVPAALARAAQRARELAARTGSPYRHPNDLCGRRQAHRRDGPGKRSGAVNLIGNADPTRADMGFGLGLAVQTTPGIVRTAGSVGSFSWPGAYGTNWWADPKEQLVVVFMAQTPGPIRWHYRYVVNAIVNQAIVD